MNVKAVVDLEYWEILNNMSFVYTENGEVARRLRGDFRLETTYFRSNRPFAWQFLVPTKSVPIIRKKHGVVNLV